MQQLTLIHRRVSTRFPKSPTREVQPHSNARGWNDLESSRALQSPAFNGFTDFLGTMCR